MITLGKLTELRAELEQALIEEEAGRVGLVLMMDRNNIALGTVDEWRDLRGQRFTPEQLREAIARVDVEMDYFTKSGKVTISRFDGDYRWLSNFVPAVVMYDSRTFPTVEHAYVYSKTLVKEEQEMFLLEMDDMSPGQVKRWGKSLTLRDDWELVRVDIMRELTRQKYQIPLYRKKLIETGNAEIIEGNTWGDTFWGQCNGIGENTLGKIIMAERDNIGAA